MTASSRGSRAAASILRELNPRGSRRNTQLTVNTRIITTFSSPHLLRLHLAHPRASISSMQSHHSTIICRCGNSSQNQRFSAKLFPPTSLRHATHICHDPRIYPQSRDLTLASAAPYSSPITVREGLLLLPETAERASGYAVREVLLL